MYMSQKLKAEKDLAREITMLTKEVGKLRDMELIQVMKHPWKMMWLSFLKGIAIGFGSVLGASLVVALFMYILSQATSVPVIGSFVQDIVNNIKVK